MFLSNFNIALFANKFQSKAQNKSGFLLVELSITFLLLVMLVTMLSFYAIKALNLQKQSIDRLKLINKVSSLLENYKYKRCLPANNSINTDENNFCYKSSFTRPFSDKNFYLVTIDGSSDNIHVKLTTGYSLQNI